MGKIIGGLVGFGVFGVLVAGFFYHTVVEYPTTAVVSSSSPQNNAPVVDRWDDSGHDGGPDDPNKVFRGSVYSVGPSQWTVMNVQPPAASGRYRYDVRFEGLSNFRCRPDGDPTREFVYPNPQNLQPYQMSGPARTFWVESLDGAIHQVRVKYVRVEKNPERQGY